MDSEDTPQPVFGWNEERWTETSTTAAVNPTSAANKDGPFALTGTTTAAGDTNGKFTVAQFGAVRVYVADASMFQVNDTVKLFAVGFTTGAGPAATGSVDVMGRVVATGTGYLELEATTAWTGVLNAAVTNGQRVVLIGTAYAEGAQDRDWRHCVPVRD